MKVDSLGQYLDKAMKESRLKRDELAARIGVDGSYISRIKNGQAIPSRKVMEGLIRELGLEPALAWQLYEQARWEEMLKKMRLRLRTALGVLKHRPDIVREELGLVYGSLPPEVDTKPYPYTDEEVEDFFAQPTNQLCAFGILGKIPGKDKLTLKEKRLIYALVQEVRKTREGGEDE